jgi:hypothetical protein
MKKYLYVVLILISNVAQSNYLEYIEYRNTAGSESACEIVDKSYKSTASLYEKVYFLKAKNGCYYRNQNFKNNSRSEKKMIFKDNGKILSLHLKNALDSNESPDKDLLDLVGVSEDYPELYERLEKKKIQAYLEHPVVAPDENEGDVHDVSYFVASDYKNMIHRYLENNMPEDAERLAKEYGQYPWSGEHGIKQMQEEIKVHQAIIDNERKNKEEKIEEIVDPKKVTAELKVALEELSGSKADIKVDKITIKKTNISTDVSSGFEIIEEFKVKILFGLALFLVFAMYFYSRRKDEK